MKKNIILAIALCAIPIHEVLAYSYTQRLCNDPRFRCIRAHTDSWYRMWRNPHVRYALQRLNRKNTHLRRGMIIAVPKGRINTHHLAYSPFVRQVKSRGRRFIVIDPAVLAWAAYDSGGELVRWGPAVGGRHYCPDVGRRCLTTVGNFRVQRMEGADCISNKYPIEENGGAPMPYCMFFNGGYAMHGGALPGFHASHGCVRLFHDDARWLNEEFVERGTRVIVLPYRS